MRTYSRLLGRRLQEAVVRTSAHVELNGVGTDQLGRGLRAEVDAVQGGARRSVDSQISGLVLVREGLRVDPVAQRNALLRSTGREPRRRNIDLRVAAIGVHAGFDGNSPDRARAVQVRVKRNDARGRAP